MTAYHRLCLSPAPWQQVDHFTKYGVKAIPAPLAPHLLINHATHTYDPVVFFNDFWMLRERLVPMNESVQEVPMQLFLHTMAQWKWQLYMQVCVGGGRWGGGCVWLCLCGVHLQSFVHCMSGCTCSRLCIVCLGAGHAGIIF